MKHLNIARGNQGVLSCEPGGVFKPTQNIFKKSNTKQPKLTNLRWYY